MKTKNLKKETQDNPNVKLTSIKIDHFVWAELKKHSIDRRCRMADVLTEALNMYVAQLDSKDHKKKIKDTKWREVKSEE